MAVYRVLPWLLAAVAAAGLGWLCWEYPRQAVEAAKVGAVIVSVVLLVAANVVLAMGCYCFTEDAFAEHVLWGLGVVLPPLVGVGLWLGGVWLAARTGVPVPALVGFVAGVAVACICPVVCVVLLVLRWRQFRNSAGAAVGSAAYLVAWVLLMMYVVAPAGGA